jgi:hypothetical protein
MMKKIMSCGVVVLFVVISWVPLYGASISKDASGFSNASTTKALQPLQILPDDRGYFYAYLGYDPSGEWPPGFITFDLNGGFEYLGGGAGGMSGSDFDLEGNWYAVAYGGGLYKVDPATGNTIYIGSTIPVNSVVYDTTTGIWYVCGSDSKGIDSLFTLNITTGVTTFIGYFGISNTMISLMCDTEGNMFSYDVLFGGNSHLYAINKDTGEATVIGDMGHDFCYAQEGKFDRNTGILYIAAYDYGLGESYLATCDPETGEITIIKIFNPTGVQIDALTVIYGDAGHYPHAEFTWTPPVPHPGDAILFNASASFDFDGYITLYEWDWNNDGVYDESYTTPTATHSWDNPGGYSVTLRVTDNASLTGNTSHLIKVLNHFYACDSSSFCTCTFNDIAVIQVLAYGGVFSGSDFDPDGNWYAVSYSGGLYSIDTDTGTSTYIANTIPLNGLTYDVTTNLWFACSGDNLYWIDINTGATTLIGDFGINTTMRILMCDVSGNLYSLGAASWMDYYLYSIDKTTGAATVISSFGTTITGANFDRNDGLLYFAWLDVGMDQNYLAVYDPDTGVGTILNPFSPNDEIVALAIPYILPDHYLIAHFTWTPHDPAPGETILFNASKSYDSDGTIILYEWDWDNDGVYDESSTTPTVTHSWDTPGSYEVTLRVTDNSSLTGTKEHTVMVISPPPSPPVIYGPTDGFVRVTYVFYTDTITDPNQDSFYFMWDWGDGNITGWLGPYPSGQIITGSHAWMHAGVYGIRARIKMSAGESNWSNPHNITIVNMTGPTAPTISGPTQGKAGVKYNYSFNSTDNTCDTLAYFIEWGDGTTSWISGRSGNETITNHTWSKRGSFMIKAKAKNCWEVESPWGTLQVTMPLSYQSPYFQFFAWLLARFPHALPILRHLCRLYGPFF